MSKTFNIKPTDAKYFIDKEKRTVVCVLEKTENLFIHFIVDNFTIRPTVIGNDSLYKKFKMPNRFIGIARCSADDEWNPETGKLIAFSRMKDNLNQSFFKRANTYVNFLDETTNQAESVFNRIGEKLSVNTYHRHNLINSILGAEENNGVPHIK